MIFRSKKARNGEENGADAGPAVADSPSLEEMRDEVAALERANREHRDPETERRALRLRHLAGARMVHHPVQDPSFVSADPDQLPAGPGLPEFSRDDLTPELLRAAILRDGCLLVRGLVDRDDALSLAAGIERAFEERAARASGQSAAIDYYEEFQPEPPFVVSEREWVEEGGGVLAADSPRLMSEMLGTFEKGGLPKLIAGYLGEAPAISAQKCTLRKAEPKIAGAWHQDGRFLPNVRAMNVWLSLSRCGDQAPGLDIVPKRIDHILEAGTEPPYFDIQISEKLVEQEAGEAGIVRPIFEPGDVMLFDDLFLHQTGSDPSMPNPRYAVESWFFGPSAYPADYAPFSV